MLADRIRMGCYRKKGIPGNDKLIAGTLSAGYYGTVPDSDLFTGQELLDLFGLRGIVQRQNIDWFKFSLDGKVLFRQKQTVVYGVSYDKLLSNNLVFGERTIKHKGTTYRVRLMKGASVDNPNNPINPLELHKSEWNRLMLPLSIKAKDKSWGYPENVESYIAYWGTDFTDVELGLRGGSGRDVACQEVTKAGHVLTRGNGSIEQATNKTVTDGNVGWLPILEVMY